MERFRRVDLTGGSELTWPVCRHISEPIVVAFIAVNARPTNVKTAKYVGKGRRIGNDSKSQNVK